MHKANKLQASIGIKTCQPAYHQKANTITDPTQLESIQKMVGLIYNEFPNRTHH
jgi:hypothetical protein